MSQFTLETFKRYSKCMHIISNSRPIGLPQCTCQPKVRKKKFSKNLIFGGKVWSGVGNGKKKYIPITIM